MRTPTHLALLGCLPTLLFLCGCEQLNPARVYQEAAQRLRFSLDRAEPTLQIAFPLDQSRIGLRLWVGVDNPTQVHFKARRFAGAVSLDRDQNRLSLAQVNVGQGFDLPAQGRGQIPVEISVSYAELQRNWSQLAESVRRKQGSWRMEGQLQVEAFGVPITVPVRVSRPLS